MGRQISFSVLDRQAAVDFAIDIMDAPAMRVATDDENRLGAFPFTKGALEAVLGAVSFRTPRKVVNVVQQLIEEARLADLDPAAGPITVEQLDQSSILDELL
jgi:hypothetical protein